MTTPSIKNLAPGDVLKNNLGMLAVMQQTLQNFNKFITTSGLAPHLPPTNGVPKATIDAANTAIDTYNTDFKAAQTTATGLQAQIDGITDIVSASKTFARHSTITMTSIMGAIVQYKQDQASVDRVELKTQINQMITNCQTLEAQVSAAHVTTTGATSSLEKNASQLNTDFMALQVAIPPADGVALDLSKLTEKAAWDQLQGNINTLNGNIHDLQEAVAGEMAGLVIGGVVGGTIAIVNFWNPVGWVAAGVTIGAEVALAGKHAKDVASLYIDQVNLGVSKLEQQILQPLYTIKNAVAQIQSGITQIQAISTQLETLKSDFGAADQDLEGFLTSVTKDASLSELQGLGDYVTSDFKELVSVCDKLLTPIPAATVTASDMANAKAYTP